MSFGYSLSQKCATYRSKTIENDVSFRGPTAWYRLFAVDILKQTVCLVDLNRSKMLWALTQENERELPSHRDAITQSYENNDVIILSSACAYFYLIEI